MSGDVGTVEIEPSLCVDFEVEPLGPLPTIRASVASLPALSALLDVCHMC
jgi:hypothetical protein